MNKKNAVCEINDVFVITSPAAFSYTWKMTEAVQKELLLRCFIKLNCDSDCEDKMMLPFMTMDTAYDKTVSTVEWNAAILPTNCFLMMYDILENYTFFSLVHFVDFH